VNHDNNRGAPVSVSDYKQRTSHKREYGSYSLNKNMIICDNKVIDELLDSDILNNASGEQIPQSPMVAEGASNERNMKSNMFPSSSLNLDGDPYLDRNIFLVQNTQLHQ
jgi:hypothetical protein